MESQRVLQHARGSDCCPSLGSPGRDCNREREGVGELLLPSPLLAILSPEDGGNAGNLGPAHPARTPIERDRDARPRGGQRCAAI
eukprot:8564602-Lingulodinium_polyedra.AAC.1